MWKGRKNMLDEQTRTRAIETAPPAGSRKRRPVVELFATGLENPTHMEFTPEGRLLVSEHTAGRVKDITDGGDFRDVDPLAYNLEGPSGILPLGDRILVSETWAGRVSDLGVGGDMHGRPSFADELKMPYGLAARTFEDGSTRIFVGEKPAPFYSQITEISQGGGRDDYAPLVTELPSKPGDPGKTPIDAWPDRYEFYASTACGTWAVIWPPEDSTELCFVSGGALGHVVGVPPEGGSYGHLLTEDHAIAWGLGSISSMKDNRDDGLIYVVRADRGDVMVVDPTEKRNYWFDPPIVQGLNRPLCVRFGADGETMFACASGDGVVWRVTNFR
jgi:hypothetical protein